MLFYFCLLACVLTLALLLISPKTGVLAVLVTSPIMAASWWYHFGPFSLNHVMGGVIPLLILPRVLSLDKKSRRWNQWMLAGACLALANLLGIPMLVLTHGKVLAAVELAVQSLNILAGFSLLSLYHDEGEGLKHVIIALLLAGIFPMGSALFQTLTGTTWQTRTSAGLIRHVGLYHDAVSIKHFGLQTLIGIYLAWHYLELSQLKKIGLQIYGCLALVAIFNVHSKSAVAILVGWFLIWAFTNRRHVGPAIFLGALVLTNWMLDDLLSDSIQQLFYKEVSIYEGTMDRRYILAGRGHIWEQAWQRWLREPTIAKVFGTGKSWNVHNEFFRILLLSGILGVVFFCGTLAFIGQWIFRRIARTPSPLNLAAVFAFTMWFVDCIGIHTCLYYYYNLFVWGLVGLSLFYQRAPLEAPAHQGATLARDGLRPLMVSSP